MDRPTDRQTELQTDKPSYRSFLPELKKVKKVQLKEAKFWKRKSPNTNSITISNRPTLFCFILLEKNNSLSLL